MNAKRLLGGTAATLGAVAVGNAALRADPDDLEPPLGRPVETYRWRGFDVVYTEAGDPDDPDLLLLHGINAAGSSHEFRYVVDALEAFVDDFAGELVTEPTVVASSLSAAYVAAADVDAAEYVFVCPTASTVPGRRTWLRSLLRSPVAGEALYNLLTSKPSIRYFLADHGFAGAIPEEWVDYDWRTAHQEGARFAPASFVAGFLDVDVDLGAALDVTAPTTIVWGRAAELPPVETGRDLAERLDAELVVFEDADLLPHAEHPDQFVDLL
ncbi:alpha/beta hydrolase [Halobacteriales archaeon QS_8_69_73]|nr:MAG: alpha/beta hydrolase [Halobacteriales archaeon QS_8_69_73]